VLPNVGTNTAAAAGTTGGGTSRETEYAKFENHVGETLTESHNPAGEVTPLSASVRVPLSYFEAVYTRIHGGQKAPDPKTLQPLIDSEIPELRAAVQKCTSIAAANDVVVNPYVDLVPVNFNTPVAPVQASVGSAAVAVVGSHSKEFALGGLALVSLFMAMMMVRRGTPTTIITPPQIAMEPRILEASEPLAGEASPGNPLLDGMELDADAVRAQQMVDQVSTMVKENPEAAANLVKRWLNRS
jgi:flagellar biosynthesis/type III secretory pathway M-ring protein FliF/YscJ